MRKKLILFVVLLLFISTFSYAQNQSGTIYYTEIKSISEPGANSESFNSVLHFTSDLSLYVVEVDSLENGGKKIAKTTQTEEGTKIVRSQSSAKGVYNILNRTTSELTSNARFNYNINYTETLQKIEWKITNEQKLIESIKVTKATTHFRGRDYTAWFAPEIPIPLGPWKLNGLPGLIIEVQADDKSLLFLFKSLNIPNSKMGSLPAILSSKVNAIDFESYKTVQKEHYKENIEYMRSLAQRYNASLNLRSEKEEFLSRYLEYFGE